MFKMKNGIQKKMNKAMITDIVFAMCISRAKVPGWLVAFIIFTAATKIIKYDIMITIRGTKNASVKIIAVYIRCASVDLIANFEPVNIKPKTQVPMIPQNTGVDFKLKCWVGNLTANMRSTLIAARLRIEAVPHKISTAMKYWYTAATSGLSEEKKGRKNTFYFIRI